MKGEVFTIYSDGVTHGLANGVEWITDPRSKQKDQNRDSDMEMILNYMFKDVSSLYPEMEQMKLHVIAYGKLVDISSGYENEEPKLMVWNMEIGVPDKQGLIVFSPIPYERVKSFFDHQNPLAFKGQDGAVLKTKFHEAPIVRTFRTLQECMSCNLENEPSVVNNGKTMMFVGVVRPASESLRIQPPKTSSKNESKAVKRLEEHLPEHEKVKRQVKKSEQFLIKRYALKRKIHEMFTSEQFNSIMTK